MKLISNTNFKLYKRIKILKVGMSCNKLNKRLSISRIYLSSRTIPPMIVAPSRIKIPAEIRIGVANPRTRVASLSGFGNLVGASVASKNPSGNFN